ncbi:HNH endonuclease [Oceanobacillus kapialis]|uniref:Putative HNH nuclease YajD n=1 Tax=Oceanobacillus kapialis TaxID=481353 RepID=A0ABW5PZV7_9BACI
MHEYKTKQQKRKFYDSGHWKRMRKHIKQRDNNECQECKRKGRVWIDTNEYSVSAKRKKIMLVVDHIKEIEDYPELALEEDNLQTLCVNCHNKKHGRYVDYSLWRKTPKWDDEWW